MVSGFERAKAEAWAYLDAITTAKDNARQLQLQDESNGNCKTRATAMATTATAKSTATTKYGDPSLRSRMTT
jgi:hypothetical protein